MSLLKITAIRMTKSNKHCLVRVESSIGFGTSKLGVGYYPVSKEIKVGESFEHEGKAEFRPMFAKDENDTIVPLLTKAGVQRTEVVLI